jgi:hypothetical protein
LRSTWSNYEGAILANLQTVGKLLQQFVTIYDVRHSSILISPDYLKLRQTLVDVLRGYPDAAIAVARALHKLESDAAADITARATKPPPAPAAPVLMIEHRAAPPEPPAADWVCPPPPPPPRPPSRPC